MELENQIKLFNFKTQAMKIKITRNRFASLVVGMLFLLCFTSCNQRTIQIKSALVYKVGVEPVARTKFYLLKEDLEVIGKEINMSVFVRPSHARFITNLKPGIQEEDIKEYIVATTTTDFEGNGKFTGVPSGVYYIAGSTDTRSGDGYAVWSVKIDTEKDKDVILLDQNNAYDISD